MRIAYADPPYRRKGRRGYYAGQHPDAGRYDRLGGHAELIRKAIFGR